MSLQLTENSYFVWKSLGQFLDKDLYGSFDLVRFSRLVDALEKRVNAKKDMDSSTFIDYMTGYVVVFTLRMHLNDREDCVANFSIDAKYPVVCDVCRERYCKPVSAKFACILVKEDSKKYTHYEYPVICCPDRIEVKSLLEDELLLNLPEDSLICGADCRSYIDGFSLDKSVASID